MGGNKVIAVDLGGTNLRVALVKGSRVLKYLKKSTPKTREELLKELFSSIEELLSPGIERIGVASPGPLDPKTGLIKNPPNLPFKNFNLKKAIKKRFKQLKTVEIQNDAACVALAEARFGYGKTKKNFIILTIGTGIGGGIIINGEPYHGRGYGGELGHIILNHGKYFENLAAWRHIRHLTYLYFNKEFKINELIKLKSPNAKKILDEFTMYLGQGIASLIHVFDPEIVVLMGGIRECGSALLKQVQKQTSKYLIFPRKTPIAWSKIPHPGILGASLLVK